MILDATAGYRGIWFEKKHKDTVFMDLRKEVKPDIVADVRYLPFRDNLFEMIVYDPPHANFGANAELSQRYGHFTTRQIRAGIRGASKEFDRVLNTKGTVLFKWNTHSQKLKRVTDLFEPIFKPLFGQVVAYKTKHSSSTYWCCLKRRDKPLNILMNYVPEITVGGKKINV